MGGGVIGFSVEFGSGPPAAHVLDGAGGLHQGFVAADSEDDGGEGGDIGEEVFAGSLGEDVEDLL